MVCWKKLKNKLNNKNLFRFIIFCFASSFVLGSCVDGADEQEVATLNEFGVWVCPEYAYGDLSSYLAVDGEFITYSMILDRVEKRDALIENTDLSLSGLRCLGEDFPENSTVQILHAGLGDSGNYSAHFIIIYNSNGDIWGLEEQRAYVIR